jgi:hypothetical protein
MRLHSKPSRASIRWWIHSSREQSSCRKERREEEKRKEEKKRKNFEFSLKFILLLSILLVKMGTSYLIS